MEDSAQKVINLDEEREQATQDLHDNVGKSLAEGIDNKSGFPEIRKSLDPAHKSQLDQIKHSAEHAVRDVFRVGGQTVEEMIGGSHHINEIKGDEPATIAAEKLGKKTAEKLKQAA